MKKLFLSLLFGVFAMTCLAQVTKYRATSFAFKYQQDNGVWTDWTDWKDSSVLIVVNFDKNVVNVYSETPQEYDIYDSSSEVTTDSEGGKTWELKCVNEDGARCHLRFRKQSDGQMQLYVDFNDASWVYNIVER
ncbi:MAG: hypothetical protein IJ511_01565 [Bacteroides sp.]|nr:hypothetical protein [Bacteroides sp.]